MSQPQIVRELSVWQSERSKLKGSLGFVPTMGALHEGHLSLLRQSVLDNDYTVLSIYVNPTQFNDPKDLVDYPDTLADDLTYAAELGVDYVLMPTYEQIYADGFRYQVDENQFSRELCGTNRPGHFTGVLTVVMKLLNLVQPDRAYFGKKDYQQYQLVKDMCQAFFMPIEIVGCATVREGDGLAMSSRNKLLSSKARCRASELYRALGSSECDKQVSRRLEDAGYQVDYVETRGSRRFGAVVVAMGDKKVRLIDNVELENAADTNSEADSAKVVAL